MRSIEGHGQVLGGIIELPNVMAFLGLARSSAASRSSAKVL